MRKRYIYFISLAAVSLCFATPLYAQKKGGGSFKGSKGYNTWTELGLKGSFAPNFFMNSNILDDVNVKSPLSFGSGGGLKFGFNINQIHGITVDAIYSSHSQKYKSENDSMSWSGKLQATYLEIPLMYRNFSELTYFEIGPQFSYLMGGSHTFTASSPSPADSNISYTGDAGKARFNPYNFGAAIGFGTAMWSTDNVAVFLAFRATYSLLDMFSNTGKGGKEYPGYLFPGYNIKSDIAGYKPTNLFTAGFTLEINYNFQSYH